MPHPHTPGPNRAPNLTPPPQPRERSFDVHDPTQLNRQGNDVGTQYRSAIFYADEAERSAAGEAAQAESSRRGVRVATTIEPAGPFYPAEEYHQDYLAKLGQSAAKGELEPIRCYG